MDYTNIPVAFKEAIGAFEGLRRLGFSSKQVFYHLNPDGEMLVLLTAQGRQFAITVGKVNMTREVWLESWTSLVDAIGDGTVPSESLDKWWQDSLVHNNSIDFVTALMQHGITLPGAIKSASNTLN